jgi:hypothetical protein
MLLEDILTGGEDGLGVDGERRREGGSVTSEVEKGLAAI